MKLLVAAAFLLVLAEFTFADEEECINCLIQAQNNANNVFEVEQYFDCQDECEDLIQFDECILLVQQRCNICFEDCK